MVQKLFRFLIRFVLSIIARVEVYGYENLPEGGYILATNHLGRLDSAMLLQPRISTHVTTVTARRLPGRDS